MDLGAAGTLSEVKRNTGYCGLPLSSLHVLIKTDRHGQVQVSEHPVPVLSLRVCFMY